MASAAPDPSGSVNPVALAEATRAAERACAQSATPHNACYSLASLLRPSKRHPLRTEASLRLAIRSRDPTLVMKAHWMLAQVLHESGRLVGGVARSHKGDGAERRQGRRGDRDVGTAISQAPGSPPVVGPHVTHVSRRAMSAIPGDMSFRQPALVESGWKHARRDVTQVPSPPRPRENLRPPDRGADPSPRSEPVALPLVRREAVVEAVAAGPLQDWPDCSLGSRARHSRKSAPDRPQCGHDGRPERCPRPLLVQLPQV